MHMHICSFLLLLLLVVLVVLFGLVFRLASLSGTRLVRVRLEPEGLRHVLVPANLLHERRKRSPANTRQRVVSYFFRVKCAALKSCG